MSFEIGYASNEDALTVMIRDGLDAIVVRGHDINSFFEPSLKSYSGDLITNINGNEQSSLVIDTIWDHDLENKIRQFDIFDGVMLSNPFRAELFCSTQEEKSLYKTMTLREIMEYLQHKVSNKFQYAS